MGDLLEFRRHARTSADSGLETASGQGTSSGHLSENQPITSSYLRAVKVLPLSSKRSKKRQSPAAKRPIVAKLTERAAAYADAHAMRLDRSSASMAADNSRKIPTAQEQSVGNFRLADNAVTSDKSAAMPTVDQIRRRIAAAMRERKEGAVAVAVDLGWERNYLRDFLEGNKQSMKTEYMMQLSERYDIPFNDLIIRKEKALRRAANG